METPVMSRDQCVLMAQISKEARRYKEMINYVNEFTTSSATELSAEERHLLSVAYRNVVRPLRTALLTLSDMESVEEDRAEMAKEYKSKLENELVELCGEMLKLLDEYLLPLSMSNSESKVFYLKMKGDYLRYMAEVTVVANEEVEVAAQATLHAYKAAEDIARVELAPTHPTRLGLALNIAVFYNDILDKTEEAIDMAKNTFTEAIEEVDTMEEKFYKKINIILQHLRDNVSLWTFKTYKSNFYYDD